MAVRGSRSLVAACQSEDSSDFGVTARRQHIEQIASYRRSGFISTPFPRPPTQLRCDELGRVVTKMTGHDSITPSQCLGRTFGVLGGELVESWHWARLGEHRLIDC